jgi:prepilin-type N-terminal cleavage/methylation domain-containing protein
MKTMRNNGITLIELIIVISIIGILAVALGFEFTGWMGGYRVESQIKEMYVDLMNARARAMARNRVHFVNFPSTTSYRIFEDTNPAPDGDGILQTASDDQTLPTKTIQYALTWGGGNITFDNRGLASPDGATIRVTTVADPDYDCIVIGDPSNPTTYPTTRIDMGKWNGSCVAK